MLRWSSSLLLCAVMVSNVSAFIPCGPLGAAVHRLTLSHAQRRTARCDSNFEHQHDRRRLFDCSLSRVCTAAQLSDGTNQIGRRELLQSLAVVTASSTLALGSNLAAAEVDMESPLQHVDNDIVFRHLCCPAITESFVFF